MKPELQNAAIAEACGWHEENEPSGSANPKAWWHYNDRYPSNSMPVPNYTGDLNAMHEAETFLKGQDWAAYFDLIRHTGKATGVRATAAQRAEAFLRTIGK